MIASKSKNDKAWEIIFEEDEITLIYSFNERQTNYYVSAVIYLGLVTRKKKPKQEVTFSLS